MRHGSLFSGIGGFDLASEWMGWENVFHCEWNPFGQKVLNHYWPKAITYHDITKTDFTIHRGRIDIITGGFPCQPYSSAGKRLGKEDERHLWPEMLRAIREIQPTWVVGENVRGLTNWNGGLVFDEVQAELEAQGYEVTPFLLPACAVNAPHRRDRIWFVAYSNNNRYKTRRKKVSKQEKLQGISRKEMDTGEFNRTSFPSNVANSDLLRRDKCINYNEVNSSEGGINAFSNIDTGTINGYATDSDSIMWGKRNGETITSDRWKDSEHKPKGNKIWDKHKAISGTGFSINSKGIGQEYALENGELERRRFRKPNKRNAWNSFPSVSPICDGNDGISDRLDGITFSKWRQESIKAGGNAIVPQVVHQIFKAIEQYNELNKQLSI
jgi:DNA (cytosine-5)-methyltransferase 1